MHVLQVLEQLREQDSRVALDLLHGYVRSYLCSLATVAVGLLHLVHFSSILALPSGDLRIASTLGGLARSSDEGVPRGGLGTGFNVNLLDHLLLATLRVDVREVGPEWLNPWSARRTKNGLSTQSTPGGSRGRLMGCAHLCY